MKFPSSISTTWSFLRLMTLFLLYSLDISGPVHLSTMLDSFRGNLRMGWLTSSGTKSSDFEHIFSLPFWQRLRASASDTLSGYR
uniref:Putative secreted protein n=1 Tax=Ixodes ricinus TaxID=34613 RepID=A0A6B0TXJ7_IXORI